MSSPHIAAGPRCRALPSGAPPQDAVLRPGCPEERRAPMSVETAGARRHVRTPELKLTHAGIPLLPENPPRFAPVTRKLIIRSAAILAAAVLASLVLVVVVATPAATALGLSLVFPGAG